MKRSLVLEIKETLGYTEEVQRCDKCKYHEEIENSYVDRMWDDYCTYSNLGKFTVSAEAHCNKFEPKQ